MSAGTGDESLFKKAFEAYGQKQYPESIALLKQFLRYQPRHSEGWLLLGCCVAEMNLYWAAIASFRRVLEWNPKASGVYSRLGYAFEKLNLLRQSLHYHELAIQEKPKSSRTWMHYSMALRKANQKYDALRACEKSIQLDPNNLVAKVNQAMIYLSQGKFELGWAGLELRMQTYPEGFPNRPSVPLWNGESLNDVRFSSKTLLLLSEQGFGDTIMISRFIPRVKERLGPDGKVVLLVMQPVFKLLSHLPGVDLTLPAPIESRILPPIDCYLNLMSLPYILKIYHIQDIPPPTNFRHPSIEAILEVAKQKMMSVIQPYKHRFKVGIVWSGSVTNQLDELRSIPLNYFLQLLEVPGIELFSFQKGPREESIQALGADAIVHPMGQYFEDFTDTAAAIEMMDLMITVDTSVAHLAGSLGKPTWILLHYAPYWLWLEHRSDTPWYPSVSLFRQKKLGDWEGVFKRVRKRLIVEVNRSWNPQKH